MYAIVEIMGHRVRAGRCTDYQFGGATMLQIVHPTALDDAGLPVFELYASSAIFAARPCTAEEAARVAEHSWPDRRATPVPVALVEHLDDYDDQDDQDDYEARL